jgi:hypothetical protein
MQAEDVLKQPAAKLTRGCSEFGQHVRGMTQKPNARPKLSNNHDLSIRRFSTTPRSRMKKSDDARRNLERLGRWRA